MWSGSGDRPCATIENEGVVVVVAGVQRITVRVCVTPASIRNA